MSKHQLLRPWSILFIAMLTLILFGLASASQGDEIKGLMEPIRSIEVASEESGIIQELNVTEGQQIESGCVLARLTDEIQRIQLELATHLAKSTSAVDAAEQGYQKRVMITERIRELRQSGNASESELIRSEMELSVAKAKYLAAKEELAGRQIERRRAEIQLQRRQIKAPFNGIISKMHYDNGEYLTALKPELLQLVQVDELLAVFPIPVSLASSLKNRKTFPIHLANGKVIDGKIHSIGVTADAGSSTLTLKIKIKNKNGQLRSGEECYIRF